MDSVVPISPIHSTPTYIQQTPAQKPEPENIKTRPDDDAEDQDNFQSDIPIHNQQTRKRRNSKASEVYTRRNSVTSSASSTSIKLFDERDPAYLN